MSRILIILLTVAFCTRGPLLAQKELGDTAALGRELRSFDAALLKAEQQQDTAAMLRLIAPDFVWVSFSGGLFGRSGRISAVMRGVRAPATPEVGTSRAQWITGDVAMLITTQRQQLGSGAEQQLRDLRTTRVYRRRSDGWELVGQFATEVSSRNQ